MQTKAVKTQEKIKCAECFRSLGIDARIKIYTFLMDHGESTVGQLVDLVGLTQPTVSYHLKDMKMLGILSSRKSGKEVYYRINPHCPSNGNNCVLKVMKFSGESDAANSKS